MKFPHMRSMTSRAHLGLRGQILLLGVAGTVVVGAIYFIGVLFEQRSREVADRFSRLESLTARVSEGLLQGREIATGFLQKPNDKKVVAHEETVKAAAAHLAGIEEIAGQLPEGDPLRQAQTFRAVIASYNTRFSNVVSAQKVVGFNENDGLQGKLRTAVHSIESKLKTFDQPRLSVLMLMMRRHEKDFMLRGDEKYGDELRKRADEFTTELKKADLPDQAEDLAQIYGRLRPNLEAVRRAADQRLESVKAELAMVERYIVWSVCITVAAMIAVALLFGRRLTAPLVKMVRAMEELAKGNLDLVLDRIARRDEIGKISDALQVF